MAQQTINTGTVPNDGTGDTLKTSFTKCNANFTELYTANTTLSTTYLPIAAPTATGSLTVSESGGCSWGLDPTVSGYVAENVTGPDAAISKYTIIKGAGAHYFQNSLNLMLSIGGPSDATTRYFALTTSVGGNPRFEVSGGRLDIKDAELTGTAQSVTPTTGDNSTKVATTAFVQSSQSGGAPQGRLTLQSGVPVMVGSATAATTIYYTPYVGNKIPIYDGSTFMMTTFAQLSCTTTDTTKNPAAVGVAKCDDWFVWNDAGTVRLSHGPDWTNDTTRSAGTVLVMLNGINVNSVAITNGPAQYRGTYVGTTRSDAGSSNLVHLHGGSGVQGFLGVWNAYNRVNIGTNVTEPAGSWTYTTATWRAMNNSNINRVTFVVGLQEDTSYCVVQAIASNPSQTGVYVSIGYDTLAQSSMYATICTLSFPETFQAVYFPNNAPGCHFVQAMEFSTATGTTTWAGGNMAGISYYGRY